MKKFLLIFLFAASFLDAQSQESVLLFNRMCEMIEHDPYHDDKVYGREFWQTPQETIRFRKGDCDDLALLLQRIFIASDIDALLVLMDTTEDYGHVVVQSGSYIFDPSIGKYGKQELLTGNIVAILTYPEALRQIKEYR